LKPAPLRDRRATIGEHKAPVVAKFAFRMAAVIASALLAPAGCQLPPATQPVSTTRPGGTKAATTRPSQTQPSLTYADVAARYNKNITRLDKLWTAGTVELKWTDRGQRRWEQGDVHVILLPPSRMAFEINKAGITLLWAGADQERYWLFDLQDPRTAYVGRHADYGRSPETPLPIHPLDLVRILGVTPLPLTAGDATVEWIGKGDAQSWLVEFPGRMRMVIDPQTALPSRIDLLDAHGYSRVIARLSAPDRVEIENAPPGAFPTMNTRFEITMTDRDGRMTLYLSRMTNRSDKFNEKIFNFDILKKMLKPETVNELK